MFISAILALASLASAGVVPRALGEDDVIVFGKDDRIEIVTKADMPHIFRRNETELDTALIDEPVKPTTNLVARNLEPSPYSRKRGEVTVLIPDPDEVKLGDDVQMSSVVEATGDMQNIMVGNGYSIADTLTGSVGLNLGPIKEMFQGVFHIDFSRSWTTSESVAYTFFVPKGKFGVIVSNPSERRHRGTVWTGTIGGQGKTAYWNGVSYTSKADRDLSWVDGVISLCTGTAHPLKFCKGNGFFP